MKQLLERLKALELSMTGLLDEISSLKEEKEKLSTENNRLHLEINQLRESKGGLSQDNLSEESKVTISERDIKVDHFRKELDRCIEEVETCLRHL